MPKMLGGQSQYDEREVQTTSDELSTEFAESAGGTFSTVLGFISEALGPGGEINAPSKEEINAEAAMSRNKGVKGALNESAGELAGIATRFADIRGRKIIIDGGQRPTTQGNGNSNDRDRSNRNFMESYIAMPPEDDGLEF